MEELSSAPEAPETPTPAETPAPAEAEPAAEAPSPADQKAAQEKAYDDDLRKAFRNATRERSEDGKFVSKEPKDEQPVAEAKPEAEKPVEAKPEEQPKPSGIAPPQSWNAEAKARWDKLPAEDQAYIAQREGEVHRAISRLGQYAREMEPVGRVINEYADRLQQLNATPDQYIANLAYMDTWLSRNPVEAMKKIAETYNVDLNAIADPFALPADPHQQQLTAQLEAAMQKIDYLERQVGDTRQRVVGREAQEHQARQSAYEQTVNEFFADKPDSKDLVDDIELHIARLQRSDPTLTPKEMLQQAYDRARWANPTTRARLMQEQQAQAEKARLEEAKKAATTAKRAAAINVNGSVHQRGAPSMDDDMRAIWRRNHAS